MFGNNTQESEFSIAHCGRNIGQNIFNKHIEYYNIHAIIQLTFMYSIYVSNELRIGETRFNMHTTDIQS